MKGAEALLRSLVGAGVDVCFANPGTSEMHFVAALDAVPRMRGVLTLFEGVATGAADGYARMAGRPAVTLLHLGPGMANGLANLHNARRAATPLVNVVGDHATYHQRYDAPLQSDLATLASTVSGWQRVATRAADVGQDAVDAVAASYGPPGRIASLLVPSDVTWSEGASVAPPRPLPSVPRVPPDVVDAAARALRSGEPAVLLLGGEALRARGLRAATAISRATGATLLSETFPARAERGGDLPEVGKLAYLAEMAVAQLAGVRHLVLAGARAPVSFFAYPTTPSDLVPAGTSVLELASPAHDVAAALDAVAEALGAGSSDSSGEGPGSGGAGTFGAQAAGAAAARPGAPTGALTPETLAAAVGHLLPEGAIVVDESITSGLSVPGATATGPRHDWLAITGGAIGQGLPAATGAAVGAPGRKVLCLEADGSAMYTIQALWTQAREGLDVTTVILANRTYAILQFELARVGAAGAGPLASSMLRLAPPDLDFVKLAQGMGVPASRATTADELVHQLGRGFDTEGPVLIEAVLAGR